MVLILLRGLELTTINDMMRLRGIANIKRCSLRSVKVCLYNPIFRVFQAYLLWGKVIDFVFTGGQVPD